jgi:hypothetical protein
MVVLFENVDPPTIMLTIVNHIKIHSFMNCASHPIQAQLTNW